MNLQEWDDLKKILRIVTEAAKQFNPPEDYQIRPLPGGGYWIYLSSDAIRKQVLEIAPDAIFGRSDKKYFEYFEQKGDVLCHCWLEIAGHRKEAIASVPLEIPNRSGEDSAIGSTSDRLQAECIKNSAEMWGFGSHLIDQFGVLKYLEENQDSLSDAVKAGIKNVRAYLEKPANKAKCPAKYKRIKREVDIVIDSTLEDVKRHHEQLRAAQSNKALPAPKPKSQPQPQPQPQPNPESLYPQHDQIVKKLRDRLKIDPKYVLQVTQGRYPGQLDYEQFRELLVILLSNWAFNQGHFGSINVAESAIKSVLNTSTKELETTMYEWVEACQSEASEPVF